MPNQPPCGPDLQVQDFSSDSPPALDRAEEFAAEIAPDTWTAHRAGGHAAESRAAVDDKVLHERLPTLDDADLARLLVLKAGTRLEQGGTYIDLNDPSREPFKALASQEAGAENRYVAKGDTDYELWNRVVGPGPVV